MDKNQLKIRKIYLGTFIDVLVDLYDKGVDYIDLIANLQDEYDIVGISFSREYMNDEYKSNFDEIPEGKNVEKKLSDEDLNQLI